jgi:DNA primase
MVAEAVPIVQWELARLLAQVEGDDDRSRMEALQRTVSALARMPAGVEREYYIRWLSQQWGVEDAAHVAATEAAIREQVARESKRKAPANRRTAEDPGGAGREKGRVHERPAAGRLQASVLAAFLQGEELAARYGGELEEGDFAGEAHRSIFSAIRGLVAEQAPVSAQAVLPRVPPEAREALAELSITEVPPERLEESVASAVGRIFEERLRRRESLLQKRMAEASGEELEEIHGELKEIRRRRSQLAGRRIMGNS